MYAFSTFGTKLCVQSACPLTIWSSAASFEVAWMYWRHGIFGEPFSQ
jgi:hypothetical protein